ncbi:hypothetical protein QM847_03410 [Streptococcus timonensis]|uniref:hypothetical protein n=1 Tax=Streptococcus timonensis TaxID=1852387 RepID=UPI0039C27FC8
MKKVLLTSALALSAIASVSYAATEVPSIPGVTAPTSGTVTKANAANNHNNRFGFAVSPLNKKAFSFAGAKTYPAKPVAGTDGKPLDDSTRAFGHNTRFGAGFNAAKSATPAPAKPATPAPAKPATPAPAKPATPDPKAIPGVTRPATEIVTEAGAANNHNNRFGYAVSKQYDKAYSVSSAETYPAKPVAGTDGKPLDDATREFGNNTRFGAGFNK